MNLAPGTQIRKYKLLEKLGEGGMGEVWKAFDTELLNHVAIKQILPEHCLNAKIRALFVKEARLSFTLVHQNICALKDAFAHDDALFLVHEFVPGKTLDTFCAPSGSSLPPAHVVSIVKQVLDGLAYTHRKKVVHCDIKPSNIMVCEQNDDTGEVLTDVKIIDFGIARALEQARCHETGVRTIMGTPAYMSPEQHQSRHFDHRTDIFSVGCVLYDLLSAGTDAATTYCETHASIRPLPPPPLHHLPADYQYLNDVIACATAYNPDERYPTATDFAAALIKSSIAPRLEWLDVPADPPFRISKTPVTRHQFQAFANSWAAKKEADPTLVAAQRKIWTHPGYEWFQSQPTLTPLDPDDDYASVTWWEAIAYCNWLAHCHYSTAQEPSRYYPYASKGNLRANAYPRLPSEYELHCAASHTETFQLLWPPGDDLHAKEWTTDGWVAEWQIPIIKHPNFHYIDPGHHVGRTVLQFSRGAFSRYDYSPNSHPHSISFHIVSNCDSYETR